VIRNDVELRATQGRIAFFENTVAQMRVACAPDEFPEMASAWLAELERMHTDIIAFLSRHACEPIAA
jgi:hypothetical protein